jgi:MOSC domain-containing protein YiiM
MQVDSVNAGRAEPMKIGARTISTGIRKGPVERGRIGTLGLVGDVVADVENHGGPDQAIYVYSSEDYAWWVTSSARCPSPGRSART